MTEPEELPPYYIELYKTAVEMADRVSAKRATANTFFLTLNTSLAAILSFLHPIMTSNNKIAHWVNSLGVTFAAAVGLVLAIAWFILLRSYRDLNKAKYKVINKMEERLEVKPFSDEWEYLKKDPVKRWRGRYAEFGTVERVVPVVFAIIYIALAVTAWMGK